MNKLLPITLVLVVITFTTVQYAEGEISWNGFLLQGCLTDSMDHIIGCNY